MLGGLTALSYYWIRQLSRHVSASRELRFGWVQVGDRLEERFALGNESWLPILWAEVADESDLPGYEIARVASCGGRSTVQWTTAAECRQRGIYALGPWSIHLSDPFGMFSITVRREEVQAIAVYPPVVHLPEITLPRGLAAGGARTRRRVHEAMGDVSQTRYYQPEDPLRLIHWPSTAHRGQLVVRETETEISGDLWIVLDLDARVQAGEGQESTEEYAVILAASLADRTLRQHRAVGMIAHGVEATFVPLRRGRDHMWRILRALATVEAGGTQSLSQILRRMKETLSQGTTLLVITPSCEADWVDALAPLSRFGVAPSVVLLDPASFAGEEQDSAALGMRGLLADAGIDSHIVRRGYPFRHIVPPKRRGHWQFKTSPLGRAIAVRRPEEA
jgi:uncharacterized protein (DUF58 family)